MNPFRKSQQPPAPDLDQRQRQQGQDSPREVPPNENQRSVEVLSAIAETPLSPIPPPLNIISGATSTNESPISLIPSEQHLSNPNSVSTAVSLKNSLRSLVLAVAQAPDDVSPTGLMIDSDDDDDDLESLSPSHIPLPPSYNAMSLPLPLKSPRSGFPKLLSTAKSLSTPLSPAPIQHPHPTSALRLGTGSTNPKSAAISSADRPIMNPKIALSSDQLDRQILGSIDGEGRISPGLARSNAILGRKSPQREILDFDKMLSRSMSRSQASYSPQKRTNSSTNGAPLLFCQHPDGLARSKSLGSVARSARDMTDVESQLTRSKSLKHNKTHSIASFLQQIHQLPNADLEDVGLTSLPLEHHNIENLKLPVSVNVSEITDSESELFALTNESQLNVMKKDHSPGIPINSKNPRLSLMEKLPFKFKGFYQAENNKLNMNSGKDEGAFWKIDPSNGTNSKSPKVPLDEEKSIGGVPLLSCKLGKTDNPGDRNVLQKRGKEEKKTIAIWALIVLLIIVLCVLIPMVVVYARGTDSSVKNYLSNISTQHRNHLLDPYLHSQNATVSPFFTNDTMALKRSKSTKENSVITQQDPAGRIRGGLRNSKFKTKSIAGVSKFSHIPIHFQSSHEIREVMNNPLLHNVFYGIDYAPKNVIYPECGSDLKDVMLDVALLSQVTSRIRSYGTQCNQTKNILKSIQLLNLNVSLSAGVWIGANEANNRKQIDDLKDALRGYPREYFESVFVGNEVLFRNDQSSNMLIKYIQEVKTFVQMELNWDVPVGTSDVGYRTDPTVLSACDFYGSNTHPFFQGDNVSIATDWVLDYMQYQIEPFKHLAMTEENIPKIMISEVGWPSDGGQYRSATASVEHMQSFLDAWVCKANEQKYPWYYFEAFDEPWKEVYHRQESQWETHWGLFTEDRKLKEGITFPNCTHRS
ncbi:putative glucan endo-1,3-beta-glucosidase btgC [Cyberlindnera fabianii]|uniref:glucan endo-1,3-beta-D-glucosidase n=1 Tax=Cyberlindnera fabianii TaxID=36022 RepID=A0A1V2LF19_CYBFA|nr:putative glucan endo-1,3-beta-glucosidase btgC [Cyberlindnera fabianii]